MKLTRLSIAYLLAVVLLIPACAVLPVASTEAVPTMDLAATNQVLSAQTTIQQGIIATQAAIVQVTPTFTARPTLVKPTLTPSPTFEPAPILSPATVQKTLRANGYKRYPFYDTNTGEDAFFWDNGSGVFFTTFSDGFFIEFLDDARDPVARVKSMEKAIDLIAPLFTKRFIADLKQEVRDYADAHPSVTGEPTVIDYGSAPDIGKLLEYNGHTTTIHNGSQLINAFMSVHQRQYSCDMTKYMFCYFYDMPSMTFTGDAMLSYFFMVIQYPKGSNLPSG